MKQFFKFLLASCLGTILAFGAFFFILVWVGTAFSSKDTSVGKNSVLLLEFEAPIPERSENVAQEPFNFKAEKAIGIHDIKALIKKAQSDDNIKGIVYKSSFNTSGGMVTHSLLRESLQEFRDSTDKFIYAYGDFYNNNTYLIASAADSVFVNPNGSMDIKGYGIMIPFFKDMLDKVGIRMDIFYAGNYKSATEPLRRMDMSPENRRQTREYLRDNFDLYLDEVCGSRNIERSKFTEIVNSLEFDNLDMAIANGLIDGKLYWYELEDVLRSKMGIKEGKAINYVELAEYDSKSYISKGRSDNRIAVVYAEGDVIYDSEERGVISELKYHKIFDKIRKDPKVKAVVLRVNSPGGSAFSSDVIWKEMEELKAKGLPVIASFGDYAASGGYYIAMGADTIVSHPKTLTGSIGVFSILPNVTDLFNEKLGIQFDTIKTSPHALAITPFYDISDYEAESLQKWTDSLYKKFLSKVAQGREMSVEAAHEVAQGRVWTGKRALEKGLVDVLGGLDDAIAIAAEKANISDDYKLITYPHIKKEPWEQLLDDLSKMDQSKLRAPSIKGEMMKKLDHLSDLLKYREPMARLPFMIEG